MGSTPKPPPPDPALGIAAIKQAKVAEEMLGMSRQQMLHQRAQDAKNYALAQEQYAYQKGILDKQMGWAEQDRAREMEVYRPLQDKIIGDAYRWDRPENMATRAAQAQADVQQAIQQNNATAAQNMLNMGVNPNSGRYVGAMRSQAFQNAALQAGMQNQTRSRLLNEAQQLRHSAAGLGSPPAGGELRRHGGCRADCRRADEPLPRGEPHGHRRLAGGHAGHGSGGQCQRAVVRHAEQDVPEPARYLAAESTEQGRPYHRSHRVARWPRGRPIGGRTRRHAGRGAVPWYRTECRRGRWWRTRLGVPESISSG
jgi:hypothetical protein